MIILSLRPSLAAQHDMPLLPAFNVQKRFISYLVRRLLGRFLFEPQLEGLDADLGRGSITLNNLRLDCSEIDKSLPPDLGIHVLSAFIRHVSVTISLPLSWDSDFKIKTAGIRVQLGIQELPTALNTGNQQSQLAASVIDSLIAPDELPEELHRSLLALSDDDTRFLPGGFDSTLPSDDHFDERGIMTSITEAIVSRLHVEIEDVNVELVMPAGIDFAVSAQTCSISAVMSEPESARKVQLIGLQVGMRTRGRISQPSRNSSPASAASDDDLAMSMAVANLRESETSSIAGALATSMDGHSVYTSIYASSPETKSDFRPLLWVGTNGIRAHIGRLITVYVDGLHIGLCAGDLDDLRLLTASASSTPSAPASRPSPILQVSLEISKAEIDFFYDVVRDDNAFSAIHNLQTGRKGEDFSTLTLTSAGISVQTRKGDIQLQSRSVCLDHIICTAKSVSFCRVLEISGLTKAIGDKTLDEGDIVVYARSGLPASVGQPTFTVAWPQRHLNIDFLQLNVDFMMLEDLRRLIVARDNSPEATQQSSLLPESSSMASFHVTFAAVRIRIRSPSTAQGRTRISQLLTIDLRQLVCQSRSEIELLQDAAATTHAGLIDIQAVDAVAYIAGSTDVNSRSLLHLDGQTAFWLRLKPHTAIIKLHDVHMDFRKSQWDALQWWLDDFSRFAAKFTDSNAELPVAAGVPSDNRFSIDVEVEAAFICIWTRERSLELEARDLRCAVELLSAPGLDFRLQSLSASEGEINKRRRQVISHDLVRISVYSPVAAGLMPLQTSAPAIQFILRALDGGKKNGHRISGALNSITLICEGGCSWLSDYTAFFRAPDGVFENVAPAERTDVDLVLSSVALVWIAPISHHCGILLFEEASLATSLRHALSIAKTSVLLTKVQLYCREQEPGEQPSQSPSLLVAFLTTSAHIADLQGCRLSVASLQGHPTTKINVHDAKLRVMLCSDSLASLTDLLGSTSQCDNLTIAAADARSSNTLKPVAPDLSATAADLLAQDILAQSRVVQPPDRRNTISGTEAAAGDLQAGESRSRCLHERGIKVSHDFMTIQRPTDNAISPTVQTSINTSRCKLEVLLYSGCDWEHTRRLVRKQVQAARRRLMQIRQVLADGQEPDETAETVVDALSKSIYIPMPPGNEDSGADDLLKRLAVFGGSDTEEEDETWQDLPATSTEPGRPALRTRSSDHATSLYRSTRHSIALHLSSIDAEVAIFERGQNQIHRILFNADAFEIVDNMSSSTWHKFMTELRVGDGGVARPTNTPALRVEIISSPASGRRSAVDTSEQSIKVKMVPVRLYVDQDALNFVKTFFAPRTEAAPDVGRDADMTFLQRVEILPIKIKLDYKPKRVDYQALRKGRTIELMNFFRFEGSEMTLRRIVLTGVSGWSRLSDLLQDIWTPDVKSNQLADFLVGISPIRSVVKVGEGVADLILLPLEQYRKDGGMTRGLQRGASSFGKTAAREALRLGARLATGTQVILEQAEAVIGARFGADTPTHAEVADDDIGVISKYASQPVDARQGLSLAAQSLGVNMRSAAQTIFAVPLEVFERSSSDGPVRAVVRATPIGVVLRPAIGATEAVSRALHGLGNQLDPSRGTISDKYKYVA